MLVAHFVLIIRTSPFAINYEFILMETRREFLDQRKRPIRHFLHRNMLLPLIKGAHDLNFIASMSPVEDSLRKSRWLLWWRLIKYLLLLEIIKTLWHLIIVINRLLYSHLWLNFIRLSSIIIHLVAWVSQRI